MACCEDTHHCDIYYGEDHGGNKAGFQKCKSNPGHKNFMSIEEFRKKDFSALFSRYARKTEVWNQICRTVRVVTRYVSTDRPDTFPNSPKPYAFKDHRGRCSRRFGTGFLLSKTFSKVGGIVQCPCLDCENERGQSENLKKIYYFKIVTATHVLFDTQEAQKSIFELFYDSEDRNGVECLYGVEALGDEHCRLETDICEVVCVTHDAGLAQRLSDLVKSEDYYDEDVAGDAFGVLVSHPHGLSKRISIGEFTRHRVVVTYQCSSIHIKKGMEVRFPGCQDTATIIESINRNLSDTGTPIIGYIGKRKNKTLMLLDNITVHCPSGVALVYDTALTHSPRFSLRDNWCRLPLGATLTTGNGKEYVLPFDPENVNTVKMEVYEKKGNNEFCNDLERPSASKYLKGMFRYYTYTMASCPGSSGGHLVTPPILDSFGQPDYFIHFGSSSDCNRSGLSQYSELFLRAKIDTLLGNTDHDN